MGRLCYIERIRERQKGPALQTSVHHAANGCKEPILLKNSVFWQIGKYADDTAPS
jgi:hypothetical protein